MLHRQTQLPRLLHLTTGPMKVALTWNVDQTLLSTNVLLIGLPQFGGSAGLHRPIKFEQAHARVQQQQRLKHQQDRGAKPQLSGAASRAWYTLQRQHKQHTTCQSIATPTEQHRVLADGFGILVCWAARSTMYAMHTGMLVSTFVKQQSAKPFSNNLQWSSCNCESIAGLISVPTAASSACCHKSLLRRGTALARVRQYSPRWPQRFSLVCSAIQDHTRVKLHHVRAPLPKMRP